MPLTVLIKVTTLTCVETASQRNCGVELLTRVTNPVYNVTTCMCVPTSCTVSVKSEAKIGSWGPWYTLAEMR